MHALVLAGVALWCFVTAVAGGLAGLVLGNVRLPVLLFVASAPAPAAGANLAISGIAAATASVTHVRAGRVEWRLVAWLTPPSVAGALAGGFLATGLPANALRIVIGVALIAFGLDTLRVGGVPGRTRGAIGVRALVALGLAIGFLGGLIGLILGSLRLPALLRWHGGAPREAIGTNLVVASPSVLPGYWVTFRAGSTGHCSASAQPRRCRARSWDRA